MTAEAETARPPEEDLSVRLVALWQRVAPAMADLPIYNPRLDVRATRFIAHGGWRVGVVTTPWFMNVVALPDAPETLPSQGSNVIVSLPAGDLEAISVNLRASDRSRPYPSSRRWRTSTMPASPATSPRLRSRICSSRRQSRSLCPNRRVRRRPSIGARSCSAVAEANAHDSHAATSGGLLIRAELRDRMIARVEIASARPLSLASHFVGRPIAIVKNAVSSLHAVCGCSHAAAVSLAASQARGEIYRAPSG